MERPPTFNGKKPILELITILVPEVDNDTIFHTPYAVFHLPQFDLRKKPSFDRPYTLAYIATHCVKTREEMFSLILKRISHLKVHALGRCSNNRKQIAKDSPEVDRHINTFFKPGRDNCDHNHVVFQNYKFAFVLENNNKTNGYVTEKIVEAIEGGAVPIYWGGGSFLYTIFNKNAIIRVEDFESMEACADHVAFLNSNRKAYEKVANAYPFVGEGIPDMFKQRNSKLIQRIASVLRERLPL